jgi:lysophospholipase L1-like esterase
MMRSVFINTGLALASILASVMIIEFALQQFAPQDMVGSWRVSGPGGYKLNKSSGTARHDFCEVSAVYEFSHPHLRASPNGSEGKKILSLGDSFTFGWLLNEDKTYISILQGLVDREFGTGEFVFINGGTPSYGTAHYLRFLEDFGPKIRPNFVLVFMNTDDIGRSIESELYELQDQEVKPNRISNQTSAKDKIKLLLNSSEIYHWLLERSHTVQAIRTAFLTGQFRTACSDDSDVLPDGSIPIPESPDLGVDPNVSAALGQALFRRLRDWCEENDVELLVVTTGWFAFSERNPSEPTNAFREIASDFFSREGIRYFDPTSILEAQKENAHSLIWPGDDHPNELGARVIANSVWGWLRGELTNYTPSSANYTPSSDCGIHGQQDLDGVDCSSSISRNTLPRASDPKAQSH